MKPDNTCLGSGRTVSNTFYCEVNGERTKVGGCPVCRQLVGIDDAGRVFRHNKPE